MPEVGQRYDVCVVGAGTVGIYIAGMLASSGRTVLLLDAGTSLGDSRDALVDPGAAESSAHSGIRDGWTTGLGGTSQLWGGQLWPWEDWEMGLDGVTGLRKWPIAFEELKPYYQQVLDTLGLPAAHAVVHEGHYAGSISQLPRDDLDIKYSTWMGWRFRNFATNGSLRRKLSGVKVELGSIVQGINTRTDKCAEVVATNSDGKVVRHRAASVILAAGTLGNTRVLAGSEVGASLPHLGSGFIDHVSKRVAALTVTDWDRFRAFASHRWHAGVLCSPRIVPTENFIRERGVLPSYAHFEFELPSDSFPRQLRQVLRARQGNGKVPNLLSTVASGFKDLPELIESTHRSLIKRERPIFRSSNVYLRIDVQQPVRLESRLNWEVDNTSNRRVSLDWTVGDEENESANLFGREVLSLLRCLNVGVELREFLPDEQFHDIFHMMGGTSLAGSRLEGVVDTDLRVFGTDNLYVAGASVFPSGGLANPTFTALALAHRLGRHLEHN